MIRSGQFTCHITVAEDALRFRMLSEGPENLAPTPADRVLEVVAALGLIASWAVVAAYWQHLPARVPQHFGLLGEPNAWGGRGAALIGPAGATLVVALLLLVTRWVRRFNHPVEIHAGNAERQYRMALGLLRWERAALAWLTGWVTLQQARVALAEIPGLGRWSVSLELGLLLTPVAVYWVRARRAPTSR